MQHCFYLQAEVPETIALALIHGWFKINKTHADFMDLERAYFYEKIDIDKMHASLYLSKSAGFKPLQWNCCGITAA